MEGKEISPKNSEGNASSLLASATGTRVGNSGVCAKEGEKKKEKLKREKYAGQKTQRRKFH